MAERSEIGISSVESPKYRAFESSYSTLVACISRSPGEIVDDLISLRTLSDDEIVFLRSSLLTEKEKARKIIDVVKIRIKFELSFFDKFIEILERKDWTKVYVAEVKANLEAEINIAEQLKNETIFSSSRHANIETNAPDSQVEDIYSHVSGFERETPLEIYETEFDESDLDNRTCEIQHKFASLVTNVAITLKHNKITTEDIAFHLLSLSPFAVSDHIKGTRYFTPEFIEQIKQKCQSNVCEVFIKIQRFYSWINFDLIRGIINAFLRDNKSIQTQWAEYQRDFEFYCEERMCQIPQAVNEKKQTSTSCQKSVEKVFKIDHGWNEIRFDRLVKITACITRLLGLKPYTLQLCTVNQGCIELVFEVPQHVADVIFPPTEKQLKALQEHNIRYCDDQKKFSLNNEFETEKNIETAFSLTDLVSASTRKDQTALTSDSEYSKSESETSKLSSWSLSSSSLADLTTIAEDYYTHQQAVSSNSKANGIWTIAAIGERNTHKYKTINRLLCQKSINFPTNDEENRTEVNVKDILVRIFDLHDSTWFTEHFSEEKISEVDIILYFLPNDNYCDTIQKIVFECSSKFWTRCIILVDSTKIIEALENMILTAKQNIKKILLNANIPIRTVQRLQVIPTGDATSLHLPGQKNWFLTLCWTVFGVSLNSPKKDRYIKKIFAEQVKPNYDGNSTEAELQENWKKSNKIRSRLPTWPEGDSGAKGKDLKSSTSKLRRNKYERRQTEPTQD